MTTYLLQCVHKKRANYKQLRKYVFDSSPTNYVRRTLIQSALKDGFFVKKIYVNCDPLEK